MITLTAFIQGAIRTLQDAGLEASAIEGRILAEWASDTTRLDSITNPNKPITTDMQTRLALVLKRRLNGEPVYRILGAREFYGLPFHLSRETLEPRDDTETLIDLVLPVMKTIAAPHFLDMGTGSGIIAVTLLKHQPKATAFAVDISEDALNTATQNAALHDVQDRFTPLLSDWFDKVKGTFDLIISNPPYIPHSDLAYLQKEVRAFDPPRALDGGEDGLDFYRKLASQAGAFLNKNGFVAVEIGIGQKTDVTKLFAANSFHLHESRKDLGNIERALLFSFQPTVND